MVFNNIREILNTGKVHTNNVVLVESKTSDAKKDLLEISLKNIKHKFEKQLEQLEKKSPQKNIGENLKSHLTGIEEILSLNDPANIKLCIV